jgi:hypothetical protein
LNCDGIHTPCDWTGQVGELNANIDTLLSHQFPALSAQFLGSAAPNAFTVHGDDAPPFYLAKKGSGMLSQTDPLTRELERSVANLTAQNPYTGATDRLLAQIADQTGMKALHMITSGDPARNATFVLFANADYFITDFPASTCETCVNPAFAWNHGDIQPEIANTWLGFVGPGVRNRGEVSEPWTDHTDVRPTMLQLLGLSDSYESDGRVITEALETGAHQHALSAHRRTLERLGAAYKQMNAPFGEFGMAALRASTRALTGDDVTYAALEEQLASLTAERDAVAAEIRTALNGAAAGTRIDERQARAWMWEAWSLIWRVSLLAR